MKTLLTILTATLCLFTARGAPIEYTWTATGSGAYRGSWVKGEEYTLEIPFTETPFTITAVADTDQINWKGDANEYWSVPVEATVFVTGVGGATFAAAHNEAGSYNDYPVGGTSVAGVTILQSLMGGEGNIAVVNPVFETWDPRTAIGPVSGPFHSLESDPWISVRASAENQSISSIQFYGDSISTVTFEAKLIPEPSAFALLGLGSLTLVMVRREPRKV